jgi:hypothetical protein
MTIRQQQDIQRSYNVTLRRIRVTIVAVDQKSVLHILREFVAFQREMCIFHVICGMAGSTIFY